MLIRKLWSSFAKQLAESDLEKIEGRLGFLRDTLEDAVRQYDAEDVRSELDLNLHIYLKYFEIAGGTELSAWLIHDAWLGGCGDGGSLNPALSKILKDNLSPSADFRSGISGFLACLNADSLVVSEVDAVVWLSFLDYAAANFIQQIGRARLQALLLNSKHESG